MANSEKKAPKYETDENRGKGIYYVWHVSQLKMREIRKKQQKTDERNKKVIIMRDLNGRVGSVKEVVLFRKTIKEKDTYKWTEFKISAWNVSYNHSVLAVASEHSIKLILITRARNQGEK